MANRLQLDTMFSKGQIVEELQCEPAALFEPELLCETVKKKGGEQLIAEQVAERCQNAMKNVLQTTINDVINSPRAKQVLQEALKGAMNAALEDEDRERQLADKPYLRRARSVDALKDKKGAKPREAVITKVVEGVEHAVAVMAKQAIEANLQQRYVEEVKGMLTGQDTNSQFKEWLHSAMDERLEEVLKEELKQAEDKADKTLGTDWLGYRDKIQKDPDAFLRDSVGNKSSVLKDVASTLSSTRIAAGKRKVAEMTGATAEDSADEQEANDLAAQQQAKSFTDLRLNFSPRRNCQSFFLFCCLVIDHEAARLALKKAKRLMDKTSYSECKHSLMYPAALRW